MKEKELFKIVYKTGKSLGVEVYVVGGYVRDEILGIKDIEVKKEVSKVRAALEKDIIEGGKELIEEEIKKKRDIDFVVLGSGLEFARKFDESFGSVQDKGRLVEFPDFDTARYVLEDFEVEFAGARQEEYKESSRKPKVEQASLEKDLERRDFTINAMARRVMNGGLGKIVDLFNGEKDLKNKIIRTPLDPDETFSEDPLRMLRAARFASKLGFEIEKKTYKAMYDNRERLRIISKERLQEELFKLLSTPKPSVGLWILFNTKLLHEFLPEVIKLGGVEEVYGYAHKNNLSHTFKVVDAVAEKTSKPVLRFTALMHDIGKPGTKKFTKGRGWTFDMHEHLGRKIVRQIGKRLRMSKDDTEYVARLVRWHQQPIQLMDEGVTDSAVRRLVVNLGDDIDDLLKLCRSDITTGNPKKLESRLKNYDVLEGRIIQVIGKDKLREFQSPVRGEEIMEVCGLKPGPTVGRIKKAIEEAILDGIIRNDHDEAFGFFEKIKDEYLGEVEEWERVNK